MRSPLNIHFCIELSDLPKHWINRELEGKKTFEVEKKNEPSSDKTQSVFVNVIPVNDRNHLFHRGKPHQRRHCLLSRDKGLLEEKS